jgi:hypothetical protein
MNTAQNTLTVQEQAQAPCAQTPSGAPKYRRVLVRLKGKERPTSVAVRENQFLEMVKYTHGDEAAAFRALRKAALSVEERRNGYVSEAVRSKALASLRGSFRPVRDDAAALLAEENNAAWSANG